MARVKAAVKSQDQEELTRLLDRTAEWPPKQAAALAELALRCVEWDFKARPKLADVRSKLQTLRY